MRVGDVLVEVNGEDVSNQRTERILTKLQEEMKKAQALTGGEAESSDFTLMFARHWQGLNNKQQQQLGSAEVGGGHGKRMWSPRMWSPMG